MRRHAGPPDHRLGGQEAWHHGLVSLAAAAERARAPSPNAAAWLTQRSPTAGADGLAPALYSFGSNAPVTHVDLWGLTSALVLALDSPGHAGIEVDSCFCKGTWSFTQDTSGFLGTWPPWTDKPGLVVPEGPDSGYVYNWGPGVPLAGSGNKCFEKRLCQLLAERSVPPYPNYNFLSYNCYHWAYDISGRAFVGMLLDGMLGACCECLTMMGRP